MNIIMLEIYKELEYASAVFLPVTNFRMANLEREYGITVCYNVHLLLYTVYVMLSLSTAK